MTLDETFNERTFARGTKLAEVPADLPGVPWTNYYDWVHFDLTRQFRARYDAWLNAGKPLPVNNPKWAWAQKAPATARDSYGILGV